MDAPAREEKKERREKKEKEKGGAKKEKKERNKAEQRDGSERKPERPALPPAVQALLDRLVALAPDDAATTIDAFKDRSAFAKALALPDVLQALATAILHPAFGQSGGALCGVLWECYASDEELRTPAAALLPPLLLAWSVRHAHGAPAAPLDALMLAAYSALQRERRGEALMFFAPQVAEASVYHAAPAAPPRATLTADALARHDRVRGKAVQVDEAMEGLAEGSAESRGKLARAALRLFSDRLSLLAPAALELFAHVALRLVAAGHAFDPDAPPASAAAALDLRAALAAPAPPAPRPDGALARKRLALPPALLSLLLHSLVVCLDSPTARAPALVAIAAVERRAALELIPQVLVATSALHSVTAPAHAHAS